MIKLMPDNTTKTDFKETSVSATDPGRREILSRRINELSLKIQGTRLETLIHKLYKELDEKGINIKPRCYLSDEWGCPHGIPVIGIPFYLADPRLSQLEVEFTGIEAENETETLTYLRHEAGHAFNYAYRLYLDSEWRSLFGLFSRPYRENYKPKPFSPSFVRHIPGWYAQKHPDEDFAETFAVWLTPDSRWESTYDNTPALTKLLYVDRIIKEYGKKEPVITDETLDCPVEELSETLITWYDTIVHETQTIKLPPILNADLRILFPTVSHESAAQFLTSKKHQLSQSISHWTGIDCMLIESLIEELVRRVTFLNLSIDPTKTEDAFMNVVVFITTLVMNHLYTDSFVML